MKSFLYILILLLTIFTSSCQKSKEQIEKEADKKLKKIVKMKEVIPKKVKKLEINKNLEATEYNYKNLSLKIPKDFKKKKEGLFFQENGTNLSITKEILTTPISNYIDSNFKKLKSDYSDTIMEQENLNINNRLAKHVKYIIDRKKYFIQIETILINKGNNLYIVAVSGKKNNIVTLSKTINNIFATIKIKE